MGQVIFCFGLQRFSLYQVTTKRSASTRRQRHFIVHQTFWLYSESFRL